MRVSGRLLTLSTTVSMGLYRQFGFGLTGVCNIPFLAILVLFQVPQRVKITLLQVVGRSMNPASHFISGT